MDEDTMTDESSSSLTRLGAEIDNLRRDLSEIRRQAREDRAEQKEILADAKREIVDKDKEISVLEKRVTDLENINKVTTQLGSWGKWIIATGLGIATVFAAWLSVKK
jgi:predicted RNase H-like nuclease (RuvC/YqgF family)